MAGAAENDAVAWGALDVLLTHAAVFLLLAETVLHHSCWMRPLWWPPLRKLGLWSHSLYLWQQLFCGGKMFAGRHGF